MKGFRMARRSEKPGNSKSRANPLDAAGVIHIDYKNTDVHLRPGQDP